MDEEGRELQIPNGKGGRITKLEKGTGVIPHTATEKLMALSEQLDNNGNMVINGRTIEEYVNDMANMQSIAVPDFSDVRNDPNINAVLVSANSFATVKKAYPNYFVDITDFLNKIKKLYKELETIRQNHKTG